MSKAETCRLGVGCIRTLAAHAAERDGPYGGHTASFATVLRVTTGLGAESGGPGPRHSMQVHTSYDSEHSGNLPWGVFKLRCRQWYRDDAITSSIL